MDIELELAKNLNITKEQVISVKNLLESGATIPFIARYRKEATHNLDEEQIRSIEKEYEYLSNLKKRKEDVMRLIKEKGLLTEDLEKEIASCTKLAEVEDIYRPFKENKKTKASEAIALGLEPLAKKIMSFPISGDKNTLASGYNVEVDVAMEKSGYIISEWISDNAYYRKWIRKFIWKNGQLQSKKKKSAKDEKKVYEMYYDFTSPLKSMKHYRTLAINRGEKENVLSVHLEYDEEQIIDFLKQKIIKNPASFVTDIVINAIKDALKRLILPSIEREIRSDLTTEAEEMAIETFKENLENLLMTKPIKNAVVLGFDPAFRTGCKLAVLNEFGEVLEIATIYPHEPKNEKAKSCEVLRNLITKYHVNVIAIGNGTASRESEAFVAQAIKGLPVKYSFVSEAGASVYSASKLAIAEFPDLTVEKRSAISIGRRVQDPLSELVKIDPKSIGVGEYQHDVNQKNLSNALDFTVEKIVNKIGVNINTASESILSYISGLNKKAIASIMEYKNKIPFHNRDEIKKLNGISSKIFEQCIGFLRIPDSSNPLDRTKIHPESYPITYQLLKEVNLDLQDIDQPAFKEKIKNINEAEMSDKLKIDIYTLHDIKEELQNPGLDRRDELDNVLLKSDILDIKDLKEGMELEGTIRNVASFGAFVDIGLHNDGLIHISKMSKEYITDPKEVVHVGQIVKCYVDKIDIDKEKVNLSLIKE